MGKRLLSAIILLATSVTVSAAELTEHDIEQCHEYSSIAAKYQTKKQAGLSLEEALKNVDNSSERELATKIYTDIDHNIHVAIVKKELFEHCVKSFSEFRENERTS